MPPGDVLIHSGDFTYTGYPKEVLDFNEFLGKQDFQYKIVIAGNHELTFDLENYKNLSKLYKNHKYKSYNAEQIKKSLTNCIYLEDSSCEVFNYKIYGSPWQPDFPEWAFYAAQGEEIHQKWKKIPDDVDILITHNPPFNIMDICIQKMHWGCKELLKEIEERVNPKVHVFGHVHEGYGVIQMKKTMFVNPSTCDAYYNPVNEPITFKLPYKQL